MAPRKKIPPKALTELQALEWLKERGALISFYRIDGKVRAKVLVHQAAPVEAESLAEAVDAILRVTR